MGRKIIEKRIKTERIFGEVNNREILTKVLSITLDSFLGCQKLFF